MLLFRPPAHCGNLCRPSKSRHTQRGLSADQKLAALDGEGRSAGFPVLSRVGRPVSEKCFGRSSLSPRSLRHAADATDDRASDVCCGPDDWKPERGDCGMERYDQHREFGQGFAREHLPASRGSNQTIDRIEPINLLRQEHRWRFECGDDYVQRGCYVPRHSDSRIQRD